MTDDATEPKILRPQTSVRYLKLIALYNLFKGALLLLLGCSLLFLNSRTLWLDKISSWAADEILLERSRTFVHLLTKLQDVIEGGALRITGYIALFYAAILIVQGIGVYFQQRWAEYLMVFATGALIPLELRHVWHHPSLTAVAILLINIFIVWFLYRVLKRDRHQHEPAAREEVPVETR